MAENEKQDETIEETEAPAAEAEAEAPAAEVEPEAAPETPAPAEDEPPATEAEEVEEPLPAAEEPAAEAAAEPAAPARKKPKRLPRPQRRQRTKATREPAAERKPITRLPKPEHVRGRRQERRGVVVSSAMDKTIVVKVDTLKVHPRYKKVIKRSTKFHAHDEQNEAKVGDIVRIVETRPLSKTKNWRLAEVVEAAK
jgi:small subunit ribosomal protein S17